MQLSEALNVSLNELPNVPMSWVGGAAVKIPLEKDEIMDLPKFLTLLALEPCGRCGLPLILQGC